MHLSHTNQTNQSIASEFIFQAFSSIPEIQHLLFTFFLLLYFTIILGNVSIIWVICSDQSLHTPMYFFLGNLSFLEICYTTVVVPQMLASVLDVHRTIPIINCALQMFFFTTLGSTDCFMLAVMAYDRYVAICHPLRYILIMTWKMCARLVVGCLVLSFVLCLELTLMIFTLPFCGHQPQINHFLCDVPPVLRLACADTHIHQNVLYSVGIMVLAVPFLLISISYIYIVAALLRIRSTFGRHQAFSTCSSHLTVVILQYGCCSLVYLRPKSSSSEEEDRQLALIYTFITPLLNPLIYSLRNKDVKQALKKAMRRTAASQPNEV
ncbi:PREDICTED: olfactory receptor 10Q1-like [Gekko japonicus]|uniref:Olfactory receptor n=1 Tax=Gekko japonicus TaxID=146911 RepID=A0ABM1JU73_GEKJA|nr:PREDICTED: olfactory receptor 10Q1-like [Gekko japonicus]XP_015283120.1 PREDICTED: olfactory receptor 10Q1-like [Gekko japonicus]